MGAQPGSKRATRPRCARINAPDACRGRQKIHLEQDSGSGSAGSGRRLRLPPPSRVGAPLPIAEGAAPFEDSVTMGRLPGLPSMAGVQAPSPPQALALRVASSGQLLLVCPINRIALDLEIPRLPSASASIFVEHGLRGLRDAACSGRPDISCKHRAQRQARSAVNSKYHRS